MPPFQEILRDEVYCQIMKQLTENPLRPSEERGWELMWIATGLFNCSQTLMKDLTQFIHSRRHPIAMDCLKRLQRTARGGRGGTRRTMWMWRLYSTRQPRSITRSTSLTRQTR